MIKLLILDVDGVLTDGKKFYDNTGKTVMKSFCDKDWTSIKKLQALGVKVLFLTGDPFNTEIAKNRNIPCIVNRQSNKHFDKSFYLSGIERQYNIGKNQIAYIGDDIFDYKIMSQIYYSFTVLDAPEILRTKFTVLPCKGGQNVVQCFIEYAEQHGIIPCTNIENIIDLIYDYDQKESF